MFSKLIQESGITRALRHPYYARFATGNFISLTGNWVQRVGIGWLTWELTKSGTWLGIISMAELAPSILFSPLGGAFADKYDRLKISLASQSIMMGQAAALFALTHWHIINIWILFALNMLRGIVNSWSHPARQALIPSLVPQADLSAAVALSAVMFNTARFIGPAIAGVVIARWSVAHAFLVNTCGFLAFLLALATLRQPYPEQVARKRQSIGAQMMEGFRYIANHAGIGPILLLMFASALLSRPVMDLLPGYAGAVFMKGAQGLAWMTSALGGGAMLTALWLAQRGRAEGLTRLAVAHTGLMALALIGFAFAPHFWVAIALLVIVGATMTITATATQSLLQYAVEAEFRGRVISIFGMIFRAAPSTGALILGTASQHFGWHWPLTISAGTCLLAWAWGRRRQAAMRKALEA